MSDTVLEYTPLVHQWPKSETAATVFRYALLRELCRGKRVLEIGAAAGEGTALLVDAAEIVATDLHDRWAHSPAASMPNVRFVQCDALNPPEEWNGQFDVVVALELIEHLDDAAAFQRAMHRVLADGGIFVFSTPNFDLYSLSGDENRTPVFQHHRWEYRAAELDAAVLDLWDSRGISCLSQLTFSDGPGGDGPYLFVLDAALYTVTLGKQYPDYAVRRTGSLAAPMDPNAAQSFLVTLGKGTRQTASELSFPVEPGDSTPLSPDEAARRSCHVILQRRNEDCRGLHDHIAHLERIVAHLTRMAVDHERIIAQRDRNLAERDRAAAEQQQRIAQIEQEAQHWSRHAGNLTGILRQRDDELAAVRAALDRANRDLENIRQWLPYRLAAWLARTLRSGGGASRPERGRGGQ